MFSTAAMLPSCGSDPSPLFLLQIIEWLCDNVNTFGCFDQIQEFILGQFQQKGPPRYVPSSSSSPASSFISFEEFGDF